MDDMAPACLSTPSPPVAAGLRQALGLASMLIGAAVLGGWAFGLPALKTVLPGLTTMKANAALGFLAAGAGVLLVPRSGGTGAARWRSPLASAAGAVSFLLGALTVLEYASGRSFGLDELLFADPDTPSPPYPGRMSPATAAGFACTGMAVLLLVQAASAPGASRRQQRCASAAHLLAAVPAGVGYLGLAGCAYGVGGLYSSAHVVVALHTAAGFALLAPAILLTAPDGGWRRAFAGHPVARGLLMRLLPLSLLLPFAAGLAVVWGARAGAYDPLYGPPLLALAAAAAFAGLAWIAAMAVRRAEQALSEGETRLRLALEAGGLGAFDWDLRADAMRPAPRAREIFAFAPGEGERPADYFDRILPEDVGRARAEVVRGLAAGRVAVSYRIRLPGGAVRYVLCRGDVLRDGNGMSARLVGVLSDETERERVGAALREGEERWRALVSASSEIMFSMNPDWTEMRQLAGVGLSDMCGPNRAWLDEHIHPDDQTRIAAAMEEAMRTKDTFELEHRVRRADGSWGWALSRAVPLLDAAGEVREWFGAASDVTARRAAEDALRHANESLETRVAERAAALTRAMDALQAEARERERVEEALRQSQKMEAVGQLTGGIAHDFNNLLAGISGSLELLQARLAQGRLGDGERYLLSAQGAAKRAAALTQRLLAFSRRQTLDPKPTDVNRLVADMEELIRRTVGPAVAVEVVGTAGLWTTLVDPNQLENALLNLCVNARDAMPGGGRITVETGNKWLDERAARERGLPPGQYVSLCVSDTGTGIAPDVIARAFDPFFTTKPVGMGTGLGLSMVYGFARQSGGQARITSEPGQGTLVCLYLPRHLGDAEHAEPPAELAAAPRAEQGETVLVVDDEPTVRMLVTEVLEDLGYTAIEAADGASGLKALEASARLDLLVTDVGLPGGLNGRQLADAARERRPGLKVLFITGYAENAVIGNGHLDPGMHVLTKPFALETLASRIKALLGKA